MLLSIATIHPLLHKPVILNHGCIKESFTSDYLDFKERADLLDSCLERDQNKPVTGLAIRVTLFNYRISNLLQTNTTVQVRSSQVQVKIKVNVKKDVYESYTPRRRFAVTKWCE